MLTAQDVLDEPGPYKYVQVAPGEFRFLAIFDNHHVTLVRDGETPISAGNIVITPDYFRYLSYGSQSIGLPKVDDQHFLEIALDRPGKHLKAL